jgi:hypothetical protein
MTDDTDDSDPDTREHIEVLRETIDRNRDPEWDNYRTEFSFEVIDDGEVRVSMVEDPEATSPVEVETDHVVAVEMGRAVDCDCHIAQRPFGRESCRHMRAVDAHPHL